MKQTLLKCRSFFTWSEVKRQIIADQIKYLEYRRSARRVPPPHYIKSAWLRRYAYVFKIRTLIETGTYKGDTIAACINHFSRIISIEVGEDLAKAAALRFAREDHVSIISGDSKYQLKEVLSYISEPVVFWLDGHYSGGDTAKGDCECPILEEVDSILALGNVESVIVIDDHRCFTRTGEYAEYPTLGELRDFIIHRQPKAKIEVRDDHIYVSPSGRPAPSF